MKKLLAFASHNLLLSVVLIYLLSPSIAYARTPAQFSNGAGVTAHVGS